MGAFGDDARRQKAMSLQPRFREIASDRAELARPRESRCPGTYLRDNSIFVATAPCESARADFVTYVRENFVLSAVGRLSDSLSLGDLLLPKVSDRPETG